jgi:hypothetical protein
MGDDFLYREVPAFGRRVFRLGLASNFGDNGVDLDWPLYSQGRKTPSAAPREPSLPSGKGSLVRRGNALDQTVRADCAQRESAFHLQVLARILSSCAHQTFALR